MYVGLLGLTRVCFDVVDIANFVVFNGIRYQVEVLLMELVWTTLSAAHKPNRD